MKIVVLGSGNVAFALGARLREAGADLVQVYARNRSEGERLAHLCQCAYTDRLDEIINADLYLLAVSDAAIPELSATLAQTVTSGTVAHTSGTTPLQAIDPALKNAGVIYPLQTFSKRKHPDFEQIFIFTESRGETAATTVEKAARLLSTHVMIADSEQCALLHLAAVFTCNFVNHLYVIGEQLMQQSGVPFEALHPLIRETTDNVLRLGNPAALQSGPAVRNDRPTLQRHMQLLRDEKLQEIYRLMSESIQETGKTTQTK